MDKKLHDFVDGNFDEMLNNLKGSLAVRSVLDESKMCAEHPFGDNMTEALEHFLACARKLGFKTKNVGNAASHAEMGSGERLVGILAHLDVVPEGELSAWKADPYAGEIIDGKLYGRGTVDDKGPAFAALYAMKALKESVSELGCRVRLIVGVDEESGSRCIKKYLAEEEIPSVSFSPDASFPLINAEKGIMRVALSKKFHVKDGLSLISMKAGERFNVVPDRAEAVFSSELPQTQIETLKAAERTEVISGAEGTVVRTSGVSAHAMNPEFGVNASFELFKALSSITWGEDELQKHIAYLAHSISDTAGTALGIECRDKVSGPLTCNAGILRYSEGVCTLSLDIRYPVTLDGEEIFKKLKTEAEKHGVKAELIGENKPLFVSAETPLVKKLLEAYKNVTGLDEAARSTGGGTYCRNLSNSVSFGPNLPGEVDLDHQPNEYISLEHLKNITHIYAEALSLLTK